MKEIPNQTISACRRDANTLESFWMRVQYYFGKLDFDDLYGESWEKKFCVMVGADTQHQPTRYIAVDCNISGETLRSRPKNNIKNTKATRSR
jgi:hypothetical protein